MQPATTVSTSKILEHWHPVPRYVRWLESLPIPTYREYFVEDLRRLPLGPWEERPMHEVPPGHGLAGRCSR